MGPLLIDLLIDQLPGVNVGAIAIVPDRNALAGNRINAAECMEELSKIDSLSSVFLVDNDQMRKLNPQSSKHQIYVSSNRQVVEAIKNVMQITKKSSFFGNFDETDLMNILGTRGVTIIASTAVTDAKTTAEVSAKIQQSWVNSIFCPVESTGVIRAGLIYEGPEKMAKLLSPPSIFEAVGEPLELFEGTYIADSDPTVTTILSGLPFPTRRMKGLEESIEKNRDRLQGLVNKELTQKYESTITWASNLKLKNPKRQTESVSSKLSRYKK